MITLGEMIGLLVVTNCIAFAFAITKINSVARESRLLGYMDGYDDARAGLSPQHPLELRCHTSEAMRRG